MKRGGSRPTPEQRRYRQDRVVALTNQGYSLPQIAGSLRPLVEPSTVTADRRERRRDITVPTKGQRKHPRFPPEEFDWLTLPPPPPPPEPVYWLTGPMPRLEGLLDWLRDNNSRNQFSFNIREAIRRGDSEFQQRAKEVLSELSGYIDDLAEITVSEEAMDRAAQPEARDDLKRFTPRGWQDPTNEKPLPAFGSGTIPTRYHSALWQQWWAGQNILDPKVITLVATQQKNGRGDLNVARVRRAAVELLAVLVPPKQ